MAFTTKKELRQATKEARKDIDYLYELIETLHDKMEEIENKVSNIVSNMPKESRTHYVGDMVTFARHACSSKLIEDLFYQNMNNLRRSLWGIERSYPQDKE